jgi:hypothetical protein
MRTRASAELHRILFWMRGGPLIVRRLHDQSPEVVRDRLWDAFEHTDAKAAWLIGRIDEGGFDIATAKSVRTGYALPLHCEISTADGGTILTARFTPHSVTRAILAGWLVVLSMLLASGVLLALCVSVATRQARAELLWLIWPIAVGALPLLPVHTAVMEAGKVSQWFDQMFPGSGSLIPGDANVSPSPKTRPTMGEATPQS